MVYTLWLLVTKALVNDLLTINWLINPDLSESGTKTDEI